MFYNSKSNPLQAICIYRIISSVVCISLIFVFSSCGLLDNQDEPKEINYEESGLDTPPTADQLEAIKEVPTTSFKSDDIILPNGLTLADMLDNYNFGDETSNTYETLSQVSEKYGPQTLKNSIISLMIRKGLKLTIDSRFTYPELSPSEDGYTRPAQQGLGYVYGGKDYTTRMVPPAGNCKDYKIYGLDCSGYMYQLANAAGLDIPPGTANKQRMPQTWQKAFNNEGLSKLGAVDLGKLEPNKFETGDIIYWLNNNSTAYHIGIVLVRNNGELALFNSPGYPGNDDLYPVGTYPQDACSQNIGSDWGPKQSSLNDNYWLSENKAGEWGIVRFTTDISGDWSLYGRCQDRTDDAFSLMFTLVSEKDQKVTGSGKGTDYDGEPILVDLKGTYRQATNTLSADLNFTFPETNDDVSRIDHFEKRLNMDNTGYFPAELVEHSADGCELSIRLVNKETDPLPIKQNTTKTTKGIGFISN